jgi:hypothetical protein
LRGDPSQACDHTNGPEENPKIFAPPAYAGRVPVNLTQSSTHRSKKDAASGGIGDVPLFGPISSERAIVQMLVTGKSENICPPGFTRPALTLAAVGAIADLF